MHFLFLSLVSFASFVYSDTVTIDNVKYTKSGLEIDYTVHHNGMFHIDRVDLQVYCSNNTVFRNFTLLSDETSAPRSYTFVYTNLGQEVNYFVSSKSTSVAAVGYGTYNGAPIDHTYTERKTIQVNDGDIPNDVIVNINNNNNNNNGGNNDKPNNNGNYHSSSPVESVTKMLFIPIILHFLF